MVLAVFLFILCRKMADNRGLFDEVETVVNGQRQVYEERMAELFTYSEDEEEPVDPFACDDEEDGDYLPDDQASDIEAYLNVEEALDEEESDDEPETEADENIDEPVAVDSARLPASEFFQCKDGIPWMKNPPSTGRPQAHNVPIVGRAGPIGSFVQNPIAIFKSFVTPEMVDIICRETNRKANELIRVWNEAHLTTPPKVWIPTNEKELYAFIGLLLFSGLFDTNTQPTKELWAPYHHDIYTATMSLKRFNILLRYIRFDNGNTRQQRLQTSKSAAIDDIWIMLNANLESAYTPGANITVDEQLFPYKGRTRFTQYIPSKPAKYGIKVWWVCDSRTNYPLKGEIYTGKLANAEREVNQGERVVLSLVRRYNNSGRTIFCDNFFTSLSLAQHLLDRRLAIVGTVRANKRFVPTEFKKSKTRPIYQTLFGFYDEKVSLCSYIYQRKVKPSLFYQQNIIRVLSILEIRITNQIKYWITMKTRQVSTQWIKWFQDIHANVEPIDGHWLCFTTF